MNITLAGYEHNAGGNLFGCHSVQINSVSFTGNLCRLSGMLLWVRSCHLQARSGPSGAIISATAYAHQSGRGHNGLKLNSFLMGIFYRKLVHIVGDVSLEEFISLRVRLRSVRKRYKGRRL